MKNNYWRWILGLPFFIASLFYAGGAVTNKAPVVEKPVQAAVKSPSLDEKNSQPQKIMPPPAAFGPQEFYGEPVYGPDHLLQYVAENKNHTHDRKNFMRIRVTNIKKSESARKTGRVRVALWNEETKGNYGKEGTRPHRAVSHWAKDVRNDEMIFEVSGLVVGEKVSIFAHFDEKNTGTVRRLFGIPQDQYIFSNAQNQGKGGPGLSREGFGPPRYERTLIIYTSPGQEVILPFR